MRAVCVRKSNNSCVDVRVLRILKYFTQGIYIILKPFQLINEFLN